MSPEIQATVAVLMLILNAEIYFIFLCLRDIRNELIHQREKCT